MRMRMHSSFPVCLSSYRMMYYLKNWKELWRHHPQHEPQLALLPTCLSFTHPHACTSLLHNVDVENERRTERDRETAGRIQGLYREGSASTHLQVPQLTFQ